MNKKIILIIACTLFVIIPIQLNSYKEYTTKRGYCSHHKGVYGCEDGRTVCCDGKYSSTCRCDYDLYTKYKLKAQLKSCPKCHTK